MQRQLLAIVLMSLLAMFWLRWMAPAPQQPPPEGAAPAQQTAAPAEDTRSTASAQDVLARDLIPAYSAPGQDLWAALPPVPATVEPSDEVTIRSADLELVFTRIGARLKRATVILGKTHGEPVQLVPEPTANDAGAVFPLGLQFTDKALGDALNGRRFDAVVSPAGDAVSFSLTAPGVATFRKDFSLTSRRYVLRTEVAVENLTAEAQRFGRDQFPAYFLSWGPNIASGDLAMGFPQLLAWRSGGENQFEGTASLAKSAKNGSMTSIPDAEWIAVKSAYFAVAMKPDFAGARAMAFGAPNEFRFGYGAPGFEVAPGQAAASAFDVYIGPTSKDTLRAAWDTLPTVVRIYHWPSLAWLNWFAEMLLGLMNWFHAVIPNYGVAIVLVTLVVRVAMFPLTLKSMKSMKKMQLLAPDIEEIRKKYADNPQEQQKKMFELYRERGASPMSGCLPLFLQMPVFLALYRMLMSTYELRGASFLWIADLSQPDKLFTISALKDVPFVGMFEHLNLLPILAAAAMIASQKLVPMSAPVQNPQQKMMMTLMPVMVSFFCYKLPAGLNLYILVSTVLGIAQQPLIHVSQKEVEAKKPPRKRTNFYAAAQARKRQFAKEQRQAARLRSGDTPKGKSAKDSGTE